MNHQQNEECIFCKIISGVIPSAKVYEDDFVFSFLDIAPVRFGHILVIPKAHHENILELPAHFFSPLMSAVSKLGSALMQANLADGFNVIQNNFSVAGQVVMHAHWHIVPRHQNDGLALWASGAYSDMNEMSEVAKKISAIIK